MVRHIKILYTVAENVFALRTRSSNISGSIRKYGFMKATE